MHSSAFDRLQIGDRAGQFGFQSVLVARAFHELADAEAGILGHDGEAAIAFRQALASELQTRVVHAIGRHDDGAAAFHLVGNAVGVQRLRDLRGVLLTEVAVQHAVSRLFRPQHHADASSHCRRDADQGRQRLQARRNE
jgi:hypothetical protein